MGSLLKPAALNHLPCRSGTYVLLLFADRPRRVLVGRLGSLVFDAGFFLYVGSAKGPGGLRGRLMRQISGVTRRHWHIDYLAGACQIQAAFFRFGHSSEECDWARQIADLHRFKPIPGFGCSDCQCRSHLYHTQSPPKLIARGLLPYDAYLMMVALSF